MMAKAKVVVDHSGGNLQLGDTVFWNGIGPLTVTWIQGSRCEALNLTMRVTVESPAEFEKITNYEAQ